MGIKRLATRAFSTISLVYSLAPNCYEWNCISNNWDLQCFWRCCYDKLYLKVMSTNAKFNNCKKKFWGAIVIFCNSESILTISISCHGKGIPVIFFNNLLQSLSYNWIKATGEPRGILCYKKEGSTALSSKLIWKWFKSILNLYSGPQFKMNCYPSP